MSGLHWYDKTQLAGVETGFVKLQATRTTKFQNAVIVKLNLVATHGKISWYAMIESIYDAFFYKGELKLKNH